MESFRGYLVSGDRPGNREDILIVKVIMEFLCHPKFHKKRDEIDV